MGAFRQNQSIWVDFKNKKWGKGFEKIKILISPKSNWDKQYIWIDSFKQPFYKSIGCKVWGHKWNIWNRDRYLGPNRSPNPVTETRYYCNNCYKWETSEVRKINQRLEKISKIL